MKTKKKIVILIILFIIIILCFSLFERVSSKDSYVYVDNDDTIDSVYVKITPFMDPFQKGVFRLLSGITTYKTHIRTGRYKLEGNNSVQIFRNFRNGSQEAVKLTIPSVRTIEDLAGFLSQKLMADSLALMSSFQDTVECSRWGYTPNTIVCMFIPNTYEVYWNISIPHLLKRMKQESDAFWTKEREQKAQEAHLTPVEIITLASIVDEETANNAEKPQIAGMYINRLHKEMPLQADPTIKYAWKRFDLRRIYHNLLLIKSPYNTYVNKGLPPGPIRIPSVAGIDAVLNYTHHNYLYMCAKEDFSGTHNFAETYGEHLKNAAKYTAALSARGIK